MNTANDDRTETVDGDGGIFFDAPTVRIRDRVSFVQGRFGMCADLHFRWHPFEQNARTGTIRKRVGFDYRWDCVECRPFKTRKEADRILEGFVDHDMWVGFTTDDHRSQVQRLSMEEGPSFVAVPGGWGKLIVLTTGPLDDTFEKVESPGYFVEHVVMGQRWEGNLSSTQGFLPPARTHDYWEAHHPKTARRCWHAHNTKGEAYECRDNTGMLLDGSTKGWYVRGCSQWRQLGTIRLDGEKLREALDRLGIMSWFEDDDSGHPLAHRIIEPLAWDDPRFIRLREEIGWKPPGRSGNQWSPPPYDVVMRVDVDTGRITGHAM